MIPVRLIISYRDGVLDPAAQAIEHSLHGLGFNQVRNLTLSKQIDLNLDEADLDRVCGIVDDMCKRLLVNEVMETYIIKIQLRAKSA